MTMRLLKCAKYIGKVDCTSKDQVVQANPDIAGIGVIVGFLSTTCLAFFVAYSVLFLDRYIAHQEKHGKKQDPYKHDEGRHDHWRSPDFWHKILSKNLLALADTQLLTGLAVQFTAMLKHCELSVYHFRIVAELAFLTTVTHLLTVVYLRNYFVRNKWINLPRVFFMLGNLALLGYISFVSYSYDIAGLELSTRLACFFQGERPHFHAAFGGKWAVLLIGAIGGHAAVILAMYFLHDDDEEYYRNVESKWRLWAQVKRAGAFLRTWIIAPAYAIYGVYMAGSMFKNTQALGEPNVSINGRENEWGFGQFLPVLLLALPIFAGWETFWEEKDPDRDTRFARTPQSRSRSTFDIFEKEQRSPPGPNRRSGNTSLEERRIESNGPRPMGTPGQQANSYFSISPHPTPPIPTNSPHLSVPSQTVSPNLGSRGSPNPHARSRSPSRFQEQMR